MQQYIFWLKNWFAQRKELPENAEEKNYFEIGLIDSLGVIELIESIEQEFNIHLSQDHFQDRRFSSIKGLAEIIHELKI